MDEKKLSGRVLDTLCAIAFTPASGTAMGYQVRCLEILAKLLGLGEVGEPVTIVEDM